MLGFEPMDMDSLSQDHGMPVETLSELLIGLELKGMIGNENGVYQRLSLGGVKCRPSCTCSQVPVAFAILHKGHQK